MLLGCRFTVPGSRAAAFLARGRRALQLFTAASECLGGELGRAVDEPVRWVLTVRFVSVHAYRRAVPSPVREHVVPPLSEALADEPASYESLVTAGSGEATTHESLLA